MPSKEPKLSVRVTVGYCGTGGNGVGPGVGSGTAGTSSTLISRGRSANCVPGTLVPSAAVKPAVVSCAVIDSVAGPGTKTFDRSTGIGLLSSAFGT